MKRTRLALSRRPNESICIGENVKVTVQSIHQGYVRIWIIAPEEMEVDREEIRIARDEEKKARKNQEAEA